MKYLDIKHKRMLEDTEKAKQYIDEYKDFLRSEFKNQYSHVIFHSYILHYLSSSELEYDSVTIRKYLNYKHFIFSKYVFYSIITISFLFILLLIMCSISTDIGIKLFISIGCIAIFGLLSGIYFEKLKDET